MTTKIIIIGAARSGTNLLRNLLAQLPGVTTWPCDEINAVWRYRNVRWPNDELPVERATAEICRYIHGEFDRQAARGRSPIVVEKTCANSLRVPFVDRVAPDAKYLFLVRDGRDVVASALQRWVAKLDWRYVWAKARFVPWRDAPHYAWQFARNRLHRYFSRQRRLKSWGPRFAGIDAMLCHASLAEVCAMQWAESVRLARAAFGEIDAKRVCRLSYESLVMNPQEELVRIAEFLDVSGGAARGVALDGVSQSSVGAGRRGLHADMLEQIESIAGEQLEWQRQWTHSPPMRAAA